MAEDSVTVGGGCLLSSRYSNWAVDGVQRDHRILSMSIKAKDQASFHIVTRVIACASSNHYQACVCLENGLGREIIQRNQTLRPPQEVGTT